MAPLGQYVFAEMLGGISEHFTAGSHEWLPYSDFPTFPKQSAKLVFVGLRPKFPVIARPVRTLVVAIPRLEGKCIDNCPTGRGNTVFWVEIVTWFHSSGGLPRQCEHWLAMTANI